MSKILYVYTSKQSKIPPFGKSETVLLRKELQFYGDIIGHKVGNTDIY